MFMSWICPKCERELKKPNQGHYCAKVNLDDLLQGQSEELVLVVDKLLAEITDWDGVTVSCSPNCIVFVHRQTFFVCRPVRKQYPDNRIKPAYAEGIYAYQGFIYFVVEKNISTTTSNKIKSIGQCDSFPGEGKVGVYTRCIYGSA
jgi:hypothetical protein